jgi:dTDP-4-dehydrorhamnose reductase
MILELTLLVNLLVIGGTGLVGSNLVAAAQPDHTVNWTSRDPGANKRAHRLNKTGTEAITDLLHEIEPDAIVDTAAFHAVDDCETERQKAFDVNAVGTRNIASAADAVGAQFIFLSTDYIFPGYPDEAPYTESDRTAPLNYYAETKYAGEQATKIADKHTILRPSVIYGLASSNFVTWALGELETGNQVSIVNDQVSAPTYAPDLAQACIRIIEDGHTGLYHATGPESLSRYEFTVELAKVYGYDTDLVEPITTEEFGQEAPRPADSTLDSSRFYETVGFEFRTPKQGFAEMKKESDT